MTCDRTETCAAETHYPDCAMIRTEIAEEVRTDTCAQRGHSWSIEFPDAGGAPHALTCLNCSASYDLIPATKDPKKGEKQ